MYWERDWKRTAQLQNKWWKVKILFRKWTQKLVEIYFSLVYVIFVAVFFILFSS